MSTWTGARKVSDGLLLHPSDARWTKRSHRKVLCHCEVGEITSGDTDDEGLMGTFHGGARL